MCGLGGFVNVPDHGRRAALVRSLGAGIDTRGGDAAGYVTVPRSGAAVHYARALGRWRDASGRFLASAARDDGATILHARYATCGDGSVREAHPFAIKRDGRTVLWGAHNGVIDGAQASATAHGREFDVDSRELYELLTDGKYAAIRAMRGWGVLTWIENAHRDRVNLVAMTDGAALQIARTACGALVWASTRAILDGALADACMRAKERWSQRERGASEGFDLGQVMHAYTDGRLEYAGGEEITLQTYSRAEYRADRRATSYVPAYAGEWSRDEWADETDPGPCPMCGSADTYEYDAKGYCATCDVEWSPVVWSSVANDTPSEPAVTEAYDAPAVTEASDGWNVGEWLDYLEKQRAKDRAARATAALARIAGKGQ